MGGSVLGRFYCTCFRSVIIHPSVSRSTIVLVSSKLFIKSDYISVPSYVGRFQPFMGHEGP